MTTTIKNVKPLNKSTIVIGKHEHKILARLAENYQMRLGQFVESSINYFRKTGINPADESFSPVEQIKSLEKRIEDVIKIVKAVERDKLSPLIENLLIIERRIDVGLLEIPTQKNIDEALKTNISNLIPYLGKISELLTEVLDSLNEEQS